MMWGERMKTNEATLAVALWFPKLGKGSLEVHPTNVYTLYIYKNVPNPWFFILT